MLQNTRLARRLLEASGEIVNQRQEQLAGVLAQAQRSEALIVKLQHVTDPTPLLALAIACYLRRHGSHTAVIKRFGHLFERERLVQDGDTSRLRINLVCEIARCYTVFASKKALPLFGDIISHAEATWGVTDEASLSLRKYHVMCLDTALHHEQALLECRRLLGTVEHESASRPKSEFLQSMKKELCEKRQELEVAEENNKRQHILRESQPKVSKRSLQADVGQDANASPKKKRHRLAARRMHGICRK